MSGLLNMLLAGGGDVVIDLSNGTNANLLSLYTAQFGAPSSAVTAKFRVPAGVTVGGSGAAAITVGQFPTGSSITLEILGSVQGQGGAAGTGGSGGAGGDCINANYPNQTVVINNFGSVWAGGGGGGKGGTGGQGQYSYLYSTHLGYTSGLYDVSCGESCTAAKPPAAYASVCAGGSCYCGEGCSCIACNAYAYAYSSGGVGGNGGQGQGYGQGNTGGAAGGAGGTNAGVGGSGGSGGTWGNAGAGGQTGASGNYSGGSAGAGAGASGRYLVKGANAVTFNNSGSIAGGLA